MSSKDRGDSNLSLIAMYQDGVVAAIEDDLEGLLNAFGGYFDTGILVSRKRDLKMLDTRFLEESDVVRGIVVANKGPSLTSASPVVVSYDLDQQDCLKAKCSKMLKVACARKTAAIDAWSDLIEIGGWTDGGRWWSALLHCDQFGYTARYVSHLLQALNTLVHIGDCSKLCARLCRGHTSLGNSLLNLSVHCFHVGVDGYS